MNKNAIVVGKGDVKKELELLKKEQEYDDSRQIRIHDEKSIEIPIYGQVEKIENKTIVDQKDPQMRVRGLKDLLRGRGVSEGRSAWRKSLRREFSIGRTRTV